MNATTMKNKEKIINSMIATTMQYKPQRKWK